MPETTSSGSPSTLPRAGMMTRLSLSAIVLALLLGGTFFGSDADFPFGPFRMYATRNDPNGVVNSLRLEGTNATGQVITISAGSVGLRRAELEGSLPQMESDATLMEDIAQRYHANNPSAPTLIELRVVMRKYTLRDGKETGEFTDEVRATWTAP